LIRELVEKRGEGVGEGKEKREAGGRSDDACPVCRGLLFPVNSGRCLADVPAPAMFWSHPPVRVRAGRSGRTRPAPRPPVGE
jgi:hypothetical protein